MYILKCKNQEYYVGHTDDLEKILAQHEAGIFMGYTSFRLPVTLVFNDCFDSREAAFAM